VFLVIDVPQSSFLPVLDMRDHQRSAGIVMTELSLSFPLGTIPRMALFCGSPPNVLSMGDHRNPFRRLSHETAEEFDLGKSQLTRHALMGNAAVRTHRLSLA
jgi:hypothetical protein